jgi:hypothetical protein
VFLRIMSFDLCPLLLLFRANKPLQATCEDARA